MRARYPDCDEIVVRDGVGIRYERFGQGRPAILLLPTWSIVQSRHWKMQVAYLARYFTVVCFDDRGSGAGTCMDYPATDPDLIAARIAELAGKPVSYRDVETDGAARAARLIAELV